MTAIQDSYDVIVVGGGPAGSTAGTLTAKAGLDTLVLDRDVFPRWHIGESLMPATYWTLQRLGVFERMKETCFVKKHSVQFFTPSGKGSAPFYFHEFDDHESSQTWQVVRAQFDELLLDNAGQCGATVRQGANVRDVLTNDEGAVEGVVVEIDGRRHEVRSKVVVDASGQTALIARKLGLRDTDPKLRHSAYYTHFKGAKRGEGLDEGATLVIQTESGKTWFWYIPQPDDVMSVGVVGPVEYLKSLGGSPEEVFQASVAQAPVLQEKLAGAEQMAAARVERDFSYISRQIAGDGWIMAGDAFGFLDPIYSTGVFLALKSGEFAADAAIEAIGSGDTSATSLGRFGNRYLQGMEAMRKLVYAYYDDGFSIPAFLKKYPHCREHMVNLLVGNVFRVSHGDLFERMGEFTELPESRTFPSMPPAEPLEQAG